MATASLKRPVKDELRYCEAVHRGDFNALSIKWCQDCFEALCEDCYNYHKRNRNLAKHKMIEIDDVSDADIVLREVDIDRSCSNHPEESLGMWCRDHDVFICAICVSSSHQECKRVLTIVEATEPFIKGKELSMKFPNLLNITNYVAKMECESHARMTESEHSKQLVKSTVKAKVNAVKKKLENLYEDFEKDLETKHQDDMYKRKGLISCLGEFQENVAKGIKLIRAVELMSPRDSFITTKQICREIKGKFNDLLNDFKPETITKFSFDISKSLEEMIKDCDSLGKLTEVKKQSDFTNEVKSIQEVIERFELAFVAASTAQVFRAPLSDLRTRNVRLVKIVTRNDLGMQCYFTDGVFLKDGSLLLSDYDSSRLVMLDKEFKMVKQMFVAICPSGLCVNNSKDEVYVACGSKKVFGYPLNRKRKVTRKIEVKDVWGVTCSGSSVITDAVEEIALYDKSGKKTKLVAKASHPNYVTMSTDRKLVIHEDGDDVVCRLTDGTETHRYNNKRLIEPKGICVDGNDNIYVVGYGSKNVHQISHGGSDGRIIIDKFSKIIYPWGIAFDQNNGILVVTSWREDTLFEVYEFC